MTAGPDTPIPITLTHAEALVLSDWFHHLERSKIDLLDLPLCDKPERIALWNLGCLLESALPELFSGDYLEKVSAARAHLLGPDDPEDEGG